MPHDIEVDWWAEVLSDSNCCVQVDHHVPPAARDKHCFTRTMENLKLQWEQKWKHATSRDKIIYGKRELWEREGVAQSSPGDMWMSQKLLLDRSNAWINRKLVFGEVRKLLFSVVKNRLERKMEHYALLVHHHYNSILHFLLCDSHIWTWWQFKKSIKMCRCTGN